MLFGNAPAVMIILIGPQGKRLAHARQRYWAQFAKAADPSLLGLAPWPAYGARNGLYLDSNRTIAAHREPDKKVCDLFDQIPAAAIQK
jgi:carboxylesterase type B